MRDTARRMDELQQWAEASGDPCNPASRRDLELFLGEPWVTAYPTLTLYENGCYRAQWQDKNGRLAGIQFRGEHIVHIVFFFRPLGQTFISRISGRCLMSDVPGLLHATQLRDLLNDGHGESFNAHSDTAADPVPRLRPGCHPACRWASPAQHRRRPGEYHYVRRWHSDRCTHRAQDTDAPKPSADAAETATTQATEHL